MKESKKRGFNEPKLKTRDVLKTTLGAKNKLEKYVNIAKLDMQNEKVDRDVVKRNMLTMKKKSSVLTNDSDDD